MLGFSTPKDETNREHLIKEKTKFMFLAHAERKSSRSNKIEQKP